MCRVGTAAIDYSTGLACAGGIAFALLARHKTGKRPAPRPVAVRRRHAPDEPLDHQSRPDRRGPGAHGHRQLDPLSAPRVRDEDQADLHRRHQRRVLEDPVQGAGLRGVAGRRALRHQRGPRRPPRHPRADDGGAFRPAHLRGAAGDAAARRHALLGRPQGERPDGQRAGQGARQRSSRSTIPASAR